jgi:hypothetical protein
MNNLFTSENSEIKEKYFGYKIGSHPQKNVISNRLCSEF